MRLATHAAFEHAIGGTHGQEGIPTFEQFAPPGLVLALLSMDMLQPQDLQGLQWVARPQRAWHLREFASEHLSE